MGQFSQSMGKDAVYGALIDHKLEMKSQETRWAYRRRRMNIVPIIMSLLLPWLLFLVIFFVVAFYPHYAAPITTVSLTSFAFIACLAFAGDNLLTMRREWKKGQIGHFYNLYMALAFTVAILFGWVLGDHTFWTLMQPAYDAQHLATYSNVDPSSETLWSGQAVPTRGKRFQDAGTVYFRENTKLDLHRSMSFKLGDLYCVAPIVNANCTKNCGVDFWAVGINCCSEDSSDFRCGQYNNPRARSGLRMMADSQRAFFRLAVLQAESLHGVVSPHPIFFHWLQDPVAEIRSWEQQGYKRFVVVMILFFFLNSAVLFWSVVSMRSSPNGRASCGSTQAPPPVTA